MSFLLERRILRICNIYNLKTRPRISAHKEQPNAATEPYTAERIEEALTEFSPDLIEERIKANLELLDCHYIDADDE